MCKACSINFLSRSWQQGLVSLFPLWVRSSLAVKAIFLDTGFSNMRVRLANTNSSNNGKLQSNSIMIDITGFRQRLHHPKVFFCQEHQYRQDAGAVQMSNSGMSSTPITCQYQPPIAWNASSELLYFDWIVEISVKHHIYSCISTRKVGDNVVQEFITFILTVIAQQQFRRW